MRTPKAALSDGAENLVLSEEQLNNYACVRA